MSLKASRLKNIPQRNKDLAFGYVKECEKQNKSIIPSMIKYLCLIYLNQSKDGFDPKNTDTDIQIKDNGFLSTKWSLSTTLLINIANSGTHIWKFKCYDNGAVADLIGILKYSVKLASDDLKGYFDIHNGYGYTSNGTLTNPVNRKMWGKEYGDGWSKEDIVEMKVDFNKLELSYKVNETNHGKAFDIDDANYKAALTLCSGTYQLVSYQHIY